MKPPKSNLDLLISAFEKEQRALQEMIRDATSEHDNLIVYYHSEALLDLDRRLRVLYSFKDPAFEQKEDLKRRIKVWKSGDFMEKLTPQLREWMEKRNAEKAAELEKQLQLLMDAPQPQPLPNTQFIDEALLSLYQKRCRSFKLIMGEMDDYHITLTFRMRRNVLTITLNDNLDGEEPDFVFENRVPQPLKAAGFLYSPRQKKYTRTFIVTGICDVPEIKKWLAKFLIEDSWYYWPGKKMGLVYK